MDTRNDETGFSSHYPTAGEQFQYELEARRLRAQFIAESVASLYVGIDGLVRRIACRIAARFFGSDCTHARAH